MSDHNKPGSGQQQGPGKTKPGQPQQPKPQPKPAEQPRKPGQGSETPAA